MRVFKLQVPSPWDPLSDNRQSQSLGWVLGLGLDGTSEQQETKIHSASLMQKHRIQ